MRLPTPVAITWLDAAIDPSFDGHLSDVQDEDLPGQLVTTYALLIRTGRTNYVLSTDVGRDATGKPLYRTLTRIPKRLVRSITPLKLPSP